MGVPPRRELVLFPSLKAQRTPAGGLVMTRKFLEGAARYAEGWAGPVSILVDLDDRPTTDFDRTEVHPGMGFGVERRPDSLQALSRRLGTASAALGFLEGESLGLAAACEIAGVPLVCYSEYSPRTERQIAAAETPNPIRRLRRLLWLRREERRRRRLLPRLAGLQCGGTPTYDAYRARVSNPLLFFDNRVGEKDVVSAAQIAARAADLLSGRPLRLAFGGRFVAMKGVDALPLAAAALRDRGVAFHLSIVGGGPLETDLAAAIRTLGLQERISIRPPMDFRSGWIPFLRNAVDLFLCPHLQGDPSSTYPEVMSCGVPIVGYDNEAFVGVNAHSGGGWLAPMRRPEKLAEIVAMLDGDRAQIIHAAHRAVAFAAEHAFERTFAGRTEHLRRAADSFRV